MTVHALDRRGRGASGDGADHSWEREAQDVAAVVAAVADRTGSQVDVYGHSYGGLCAFGAAALSDRVRRLVLYEGWPAVDPVAFALPAGFLEHLEALLAAGSREAVVETVFRDLVGMPDAELEAVRSLPSWQARIAAAHTVPRELRVYERAVLDPVQAARISAPVLLLTGADSQDPSAGDVELVARALADARVAVLDGQQHVADLLAPEEFTRHVLDFLHGSS